MIQSPKFGSADEMLPDCSEKERKADTSQRQLKLKNTEVNTNFLSELSSLNEGISQIVLKPACTSQHFKQNYSSDYSCFDIPPVVTVLD